MSVLGNATISEDRTFFSGGFPIMVTCLGNDTPTVQQNAVTAWDQYLRSGDYCLGTNMSGFWAALQHLANVPGLRVGAEFGTLANVSLHAPDIAGSGGYMISYDIENGVSPAGEVSNFSGSISSGQGMAQAQGLTFFCTPGPPMIQSGGLTISILTSGMVQKCQFQTSIGSGALGCANFIQTQISSNMSGQNVNNATIITQFSSQRAGVDQTEHAIKALVSGGNFSGVQGIHLFRTADQAGVDWTTNILRFMRGGAIG